jgi:hypothetical protein
MMSPGRKAQRQDLLILELRTASVTGLFQELVDRVAFQENILRISPSVFYT